MGTGVVTISKGHSKPKSTIRKLQILHNTLTFYKDFGEMLQAEREKKTHSLSVFN